MYPRLEDEECQRLQLDVIAESTVFFGKPIFLRQNPRVAIISKIS